MSDDFFAVAAKDDAIAALRDRLAALERELAEAHERNAQRAVEVFTAHQDLAAARAEVEAAFRAGYTVQYYDEDGDCLSPESAWSRYQQERKA